MARHGDLRSVSATTWSRGCLRTAAPSVATRYDNRQLLVRIDATGTQFGRVTPLTDGYGGDLDPSMARGGRLVFSSTRDGNRHLWTADADGRNVRPLTSGPAQDYRPAMSLDGTTVAFISDRGGQRYFADRGLWRRAAQARRRGASQRPGLVAQWHGDRVRRRRRRVARPVSVSIANGTSRRISTPNVPGEPQWSPTRDMIAYLETATTGPAFIGLAFVTPDGAPQYVDQPRAPNINTGFANGMLAWSPDGRRLVITSQTTNAVTSVWIAEPGAPTPFRKLLDLPVGPRIRGLTWTPEGTAIIVGQTTPAATSSCWSGSCRNTDGSRQTMDAPHQVTRLLHAWARRRGCPGSLLPLVEAEIHRIARIYMAGERAGNSLQATALVNEAYIRLVDAQRVRWQDRVHFVAMAARTMRRVLVDHARAKGYQKRGGDAVRVTFDERLLPGGQRREGPRGARRRAHRSRARRCPQEQSGGAGLFGELRRRGRLQRRSVCPSTVMRNWKFANMAACKLGRRRTHRRAATSGCRICRELRDE